MDEQALQQLADWSLSDDPTHHEEDWEALIQSVTDVLDGNRAQAVLVLRAVLDARWPICFDRPGMWPNEIRTAT